jgi:hypothetical protein
MLLALLAHQPGPGDPELLHWIKDRLDVLISLDPLVVVLVLGALVLVIPAVVFIMYARYRRPSSSLRS